MEGELEYVLSLTELKEHQRANTVNDRLNVLGVYLKIQNFKGAFIREGRLIQSAQI